MDIIKQPHGGGRSKENSVGRREVNSGKYKVIKEIHVFDCALGQIKIPKGKTVEIKENGFVGIVDGNKFPARMIDICESHLQRIYD